MCLAWISASLNKIYPHIRPHKALSLYCSGVPNGILIISQFQKYPGAFLYIIYYLFIFFVTADWMSVKIIILLLSLKMQSFIYPLASLIFCLFFIYYIFFFTCFKNGRIQCSAKEWKYLPSLLFVR